MKSQKGEPERWVGDVPSKCQLCGAVITDTFIDGRIASIPAGPWSIMCETCHEEHGSGFGTGQAQKYQKEGEEYIRTM